MWLHSLKVAQLLRSAACLHTNQSRSYLNHLVVQSSGSSPLGLIQDNARCGGVRVDIIVTMGTVVVSFSGQCCIVEQLRSVQNEL